MLRYSFRIASVCAAALVVAACTGGKGDALSQDSALARDLARAGADSMAQPQLTDLPDTAQAPAAQPSAVVPPSVKPKSAAPKPQAKAAQPTPAAPAPTNTTPSGNTVSAGSGAGEKPLGSLAAGTQLVLQSTEKVCTNSNKVGDRFVATTSEAVTGSNGAVIPAGSKVVLEVTQLKRSENTNDKIEMGFRVVSLSVGDRTYAADADITTAEIDRVRNSSKGNDTKKVLGGAVAGAIIGQIIGKNPKGTVIGAAAGAAAGGAAAAASANYEGCVNSGGHITIKLNSALTVAASN